MEIPWAAGMNNCLKQLISLQLAALNGFKELTQLLLECGADPLAKSEVGPKVLPGLVVI